MLYRRKRNLLYIGRLLIHAGFFLYIEGKENILQPMRAHRAAMQARPAAGGRGNEDRDVIADQPIDND